MFKIEIVKFERVKMTNGKDLPNKQEYPADQDIKLSETPVKNKLKRKWTKNRIVRVVVIFFILVTVIIGVFFSYNWFKKEFASVKIGENTLTRKQIRDYQTELDKFYENNPDSAKPDGKNTAELARDELIMNYALKAKTSDCKVPAPTDDDLRGYLDIDAGYDFVKTRAETIYYQEKMNSCLINNKKILRVSVMYDSPYFRSLVNQGSSLAEKEMQSVKQRLIDEYQTPMKQGKSVEDIASKTDIDYTDGESYRINMDERNKQAVVMSWIDNYNFETSRYNDVDDLELGFDAGVTIGANDTADKLNTQGQVSDVYISKNGEIIVMRLESKTGEFNSWNDFLSDTKESIDKDVFGNLFNENANAVLIISANKSQYDIQSVNFTGGNPHAIDPAMDPYNECYMVNYWNNNIGLPGKWRAQHNMVYIWTFKDDAGNPVQGAKVNSAQDTSICGYRSSDTSRSNGIAYSIATCNTFGPQMSVALPSGYKKRSNTDKQAADLGGGWFGTNGQGPRYKTIIVDKSNNWSVSGESYVKNNQGAWAQGIADTVQYKPGKVIGFHHKARSTGNSGGSVRAAVDKYVGPSVPGAYGSGFSTYTMVGENMRFNANQQNFIYVDNGKYNYTLQPSDIGNYVCMNLNMSWANSKQSGTWARSKPACVKITASPLMENQQPNTGNDANICDIKKMRDGRSNVTDFKMKSGYITGATSLAENGKNVSRAYNEGKVGYSYRASNNINNQLGGLVGLTNLSGLTGRTENLTTTQNHVGVATYFGTSSWGGQAKNSDGKVDIIFGSGTAGACIYVPYEYELEPGTTIDTTKGGPNQPVIPKEPGENYVPKLIIDNPGGGTTTKTKETQWKISTFVINGDNEEMPIPGGGNSGNGNPESYYGGKGTPIQDYNLVKQGQNSALPNNPVINWSEIQTTPDLPIGSRVCWTVSAQPRSSDSDEWAHAYPVCITVTKKPKMQIQGSGVYSAGGIKTGVTTISNGGQKFGSWVEYEAAAGKSKSITGLSSASGLMNTVQTPQNLNKLTLNNKKAPYGDWGTWTGKSKGMIENFRNRYENAATNLPSNSSISISPANNAKMTSYKVNGNKPIGATTFSSGQSAVVFVQGTLTITGNINMNTSGSKSIGHIPQLILIADNIKVAKGVDKIDAWLLAENSVRTCDVTDSKKVNDDNCGGNKLQINGPVLAKNVESWRTAGSGKDNWGEPAEVYNLRPDSFIWAYGQSSGEGKMITTFSKELPPRF